MSFKVLYVTATMPEAEALKRISGIMSLMGGYRFGNLEISVLVTGVGSAATAWGIKQWISENGKPDLAINGGIAGSYKIEKFAIGDVVMPGTDCFADSGIEDGEIFLTLFEAGLSAADEFPFQNGLLHTDARYSIRIKTLLKSVNAITVNSATGSECTKIKLINKYNPDIETMEGATFFYICAMENIPFLALRAISNRVEPRDKSKWNIPLALDRLSEKLKEVLIRLE